jgi:5'-deoxynucleotidase YfbR-like HD superfamily hydrolase
MTENTKGLVDIGKLVLQFARVNRVTRHEDGTTPESDTDHTVMLSVCACALAKKLYPDSLDVGLVAQFAIVHDLVEAYAMDTDSFGLNEEGKKVKDTREHESYLRIEREFSSTYPWLPDTIAKYEKLDTREARFVKTLDKVMPKITHILNQGKVFIERGDTIESMQDHFQTQHRECTERYAYDLPELSQILKSVGEHVITVVLEKRGAS